MSSVTSFLRQIPTGLSTYTVDASNLYVFVADSANYVGNYPPGHMVAAGAGVIGGAAPQVVRDMGKTIKAPIRTGSTDGTPGFFRAVQILSPVPVATCVSVSNFGVEGSVPGSLPTSGNRGDMGYNTFYVPIVVGGVIAGGANPTTSTP